MSEAGLALAELIMEKQISMAQPGPAQPKVLLGTLGSKGSLGPYKVSFWVFLFLFFFHIQMLCLYFRLEVAYESDMCALLVGLLGNSLIF